MDAVLKYVGSFLGIDDNEEEENGSETLSRRPQQQQGQEATIPPPVPPPPQSFPSTGQIGSDEDEEEEEEDTCSNASGQADPEIPDQGPGGSDEEEGEGNNGEEGAGAEVIRTLCDCGPGDVITLYGIPMAAVRYWLLECYLAQPSGPAVQVFVPDFTSPAFFASRWGATEQLEIIRKWLEVAEKNTTPRLLKFYPTTLRLTIDTIIIGVNDQEFYEYTPRGLFYFENEAYIKAIKTEGCYQPSQLTTKALDANERSLLRYFRAIDEDLETYLTRITSRAGDEETATAPMTLNTFKSFVAAHLSGSSRCYRRIMVQLKRDHESLDADMAAIQRLFSDVQIVLVAK